MQQQQQKQISQFPAFLSALKARLSSEDSGLELSSEQVAVLMRLVSESETALNSSKPDKKLKRARSGYQLFKMDVVVKARVRSANQDADFATFSKALSTEWSSISDEDKEPFLEKARVEKEAFDVGKKKRSLSGYQLFKMDDDSKVRVRRANPDADFATFSKALSTEWTSLSDEDKQPFLEKAAEDRDVFMKSKRKRARSGYQLFKMDGEVKARVRAANQDADFATFSKALATEWSSLSEEDKQPFLDKAKEEKEAFTQR